ncbi:Formate hydrogenlyase transcriptional activator [Planctomycetes bacterium K23_9]|uniref:Formate hydrogenlyase transcriptional activator n=2 Tax=Stieleria marina TaxID=1930275 RepID=A0A517NUP5_9BACT|nr:Formate hydrogenlyase transcriptional activator [Planctomycetes bacterium K23_9]
MIVSQGDQEAAGGRQFFSACRSRATRYRYDERMIENQIPLIADPRKLLLEMARCRQLSEVLSLIVATMADSPAVALARIWLIKPGEGCGTCPRQSECPDRTNCLHLVASAGTSLADPGDDLSRLDGNFRRFPIGVRKVGRIAATGQAMEVPSIEGEPDWLVRPEWAKAEGIRSFAGQPLVHQGQVLGVLSIFARTTMGDDCTQWLRMIADHAAGALANATAWEQIETLKRRLELENDYLQDEVRQQKAFGDIIGDSSAIRKVGEQIDLVAPTNSTILVTGESGTGKELVAREVHRRSNRSDKPLIKVNCAAIPRELYDSEFFGHSKGSFTGAVQDRIGRFELADGGTLFLDEIGEIPLDLQSKLLRVLQEGELVRVGEQATRKVDVRIIAATNRDLKAESDAGRFRADLYYRLSVFPIELPPLSKRRDDIPLLAKHLLSHLARRLGKPLPKLTLANVKELQAHDWPGNIRELQHVLERAFILARSNRLHFELPSASTANAPEVQVPLGSDNAEILTAAELKALEAQNIRRALNQSGGKVYGAGGAAELMQMKPTTLASRMKSLGISMK